MLAGFEFFDNSGCLASQYLNEPLCCPNCGFNKVSVVPMRKEAMHHAAFRCGQCDYFLLWALKPANQAKQQRRQQTVNCLLKSSQLSQWEGGFLQGLKGKKISPKQQEVLNQIEAKVGVKG